MWPWQQGQLAGPPPWDYASGPTTFGRPASASDVEADNLRADDLRLRAEHFWPTGLLSYPRRRPPAFGVAVSRRTRRRLRRKSSRTRRQGHPAVRTKLHMIYASIQLAGDLWAQGVFGPRAEAGRSDVVVGPKTEAGRPDVLVPEAEAGLPLELCSFAAAPRTDPPRGLPVAADEEASVADEFMAAAARPSGCRRCGGRPFEPRST